MTLEVTIANRQRKHRVDGEHLRDLFLRLVAVQPPQDADRVALCLVSDRRMAEYNRRYRGRSGPTDVLAFPGDGGRDAEGGLHLGDIAISVETAARQAKRAGHTLERELAVLMIHGYLHLLGFDHTTDGGRMMRIQRRLTRQLAPRAQGAP